MRRARRAFTCVLVLFLSASAQQAYALWGWIEKLSGPGGFVGMDFLFPYALSTRELDVQLNNANLLTLERLGIESAELPTECEKFLESTEYHRLLRRDFGIALAARDATENCTNRTSGGLLDTFLTEMTRIRGERQQQRPTVTREVAQDVKADLEVANDLVLQRLNEQLRQKTRRFGADPAGVFGGFKSIPAISGNRYFTLSLGVAFAHDNDIRYADGFAGDRDVVWLSVYPAFEQRFKAGLDWFVQAGPAAHYFLGAQFDDFWMASARFRLGVQYKWFYVGAQLDYFFSAITPDKFGAVPDSTDQDRRVLGVVFGLDLTRSLQGRRARKD